MVFSLRTQFQLAREVHGVPIVCGIYPQKGRRALACHVLPGTEEIVFGVGGGLIEVLYAATGFLHVRREAYLTIREQLRLPVCKPQFGRPMHPYFLRLMKETPEGMCYLGEDFAFCERARQRIGDAQQIADGVVGVDHLRRRERPGSARVGQGHAAEPVEGVIRVGGDLQRELAALGRGELWHPLTDDAYRTLLVEGLEEIESELAGEEPPWRPDDSGSEWDLGPPG